MKIIDGFKVGAKEPIDKRFKVDNLNEVETPYEGLIVFHNIEKKFYKFVNNTFKELIGDVADSDFIGTGATTSRNYKDRAMDSLHIKDFGGVGDDASSNDNQIALLKKLGESATSYIANMSGGNYKHTTAWQNNVSPTYMRFNAPTVLGLLEGCESKPNVDNNNPVLFVQKHISYNAENDDRFAHTVGGIFGEVVAHGNGKTGTSDNNGTWIGILGNSKVEVKNLGTETNPDFDAKGSCIGVAGFAESGGFPGDGNISCGIWGYATTPTLTQSEYDNLPVSNYSAVGAEVNIQINQPDVGEQSALIGKGATAGLLCNNYRSLGEGVKDWTFGIILAGTPNDGNYLSPYIDNWSGYHCGILIDKIKEKGIRFGVYMKPNSYGIYFPDNFVNGNELKAGIYMGNTKLNMGQYTGATFNDGDLWNNAGKLYYKSGGATKQVAFMNDIQAPVNTTTTVEWNRQVGNSTINLGTYTGTTFNDGDMWRNGDTIYYKTGGITYSMMLHGKNIFSDATELRATVDNTMNLGNPSFRFANEYFGTAPIVTSDRNKKTEIVDINDSILNIWSELNFKQYKFIDSTNEYTRTHFGVVAQDIKELFEKYGLNAFEYGLLCKDTDEEGNEIYGVRYDELFAIESAYQRKKIAEQEERIKVLESKFNI